MNEQVENNVRELRRENNRMTQQELAETVGVSRQTIIAVESNRYTPSLVLAIKIARAFGRSVEDIFKYKP
jgi:putative transcriptional regulator